MYMCGIHVHVCMSAHCLVYTGCGSGKGCKRKGKKKIKMDGKCKQGRKRVINEGREKQNNVL